MAVPYWCTLKDCPLDWGYVHYQPSVPGNAFMLAAFGVLTVPALYLGITHKVKLFTGCFMVGLLGEVVGYIGRILLHNDPFSKVYFLMYLVCTTIAPTFTAAAVYLTLARIVVVYGEDISRIRPRTYTLFFSGLDLIALVVQAVGGGMAAVVVLQWKIDRGTDIMVAGLAVQVFSLVTFIALCLEYAMRVRKHRDRLNLTHATLYNSARFKGFLGALAVATVFLFIRAVFRVAELSGGFRGKLAQKQVLFMVLDGAMVLLACIILMVFHPGPAFSGVWERASFHWGSRKSDNESVIHHSEMESVTHTGKD
ncbi:Efflux pump himE [Penicillium lagena]|uniref:Efflux pump himE n=1 Tax=Penicillium lagena TaxID=94218 RepID=UPI0025417734|nr:Efflux pump himE [Penicillium lagena]KAJ5619675.1 Efflux pump himE [Penicillium lagena]